MITYLVKKGDRYLHGMSEWVDSQREAMRFSAESEKGHGDIRRVIEEVATKKKARIVRLAARGYVYGLEVEMDRHRPMTAVSDDLCKLNNVQRIVNPWSNFPITTPFPWRRLVYLHNNLHRRLMATRQTILSIEGVTRCEITPLQKIAPTSDDLLAAGGMPSVR